MAVSARLCAAAIGTDTSFSIVGCAEDNGVTGYKPPCGTLSNKGIVPIAHTLDSAGPITQSLNDAIIIYRAMCGRPFPDIVPAKPETIRLAVNQYKQDIISNEQMTKYEAVLRAIRRDGGHVTTLTHPAVVNQKDIMRCEFKHDLEKYLKKSTTELKTLKEIIAFYERNPQYMPYGISYLYEAMGGCSCKLDDKAYLMALNERKRLRAVLTEELQDVDAVLMTGPSNIMHFVGFPSLALRLGMTKSDNPMGMILYGPDENRLLSAALTLETYCKPISLPKLK